MLTCHVFGELVRGPSEAPGKLQGCFRERPQAVERPQGGSSENPGRLQGGSREAPSSLERLQGGSRDRHTDRPNTLQLQEARRRRVGAIAGAQERSRALSGPCRRRRVGAAVALASGLAPSLASGLAGLATGLGPGPRRLRRPRRPRRLGRSQARSGFVENATFSLPTWMETKNKVRDAR